MSEAQSNQARRLVTGAVVVIPKLFIVTLEVTEFAGLIPCPQQSGSWEYTGRCQKAERSLFEELQCFIAGSGITRVILRAGALRGRHLAGPPAFKIETMLLLIPGLAVDILSARSKSSWISREDPALPEPSAASGKKPRHNGEQRAIETAAFAALHAGDPRYFPEKGSTCP